MFRAFKTIKLVSIMTGFALFLFFAAYSFVVTAVESDPLPDLTVESIVVTPTIPEVNESVTIVVTGKNSGTVDLTDSTGLDSYSYLFENFTSATSTDPDVNQVPTTTDPLVPDETFMYTWTGMFTSTGTKDLLFSIDDLNTLAESDETNNTATSTVIIVEAPDETAPIISAISVTDIATSTATINWDTDESSTGVVHYGLTDVYGMSTSSSALMMDHMFLLSGLTPSSTYHFMVKSMDGSDNEATSTDHTFTTLTTATDDTGDDNDDSGKVIVCHWTNGRKGYNEISVSQSGWLNGHRKHVKDFIKSGDSCADGPGSSGTDDSDDDTSIGNGVLARLRARIQQLQYRISQFEQEVVHREKQLVKRINKALTQRLRGHILLQVENSGEAWYVDSDSDQRYYLRDGRSAYQALQAFGLGITDSDIEQIPIGLNDQFVQVDTDGDGLPDQLEISLGSDPENADTDGDGINDKQELLNNYDPSSQRRFNYNNALVNRLKGKILLQVQKHGEAWWINPDDGKRYYMKDGDQAYNIMRFLSLGITNSDLQQIDVGSLDAE